MADAMVERSGPSARFFCHRCNIEFDHILQDFTCPFCASGFIEMLEANEPTPGSDDNDHEFSDADMSNIDDNLDDSDDTHQSTPPMLNDLAFLMSGGRLRGTGRRETLMEQLVWMIGGARGAGGAAGGPGGASNAAPFVLVGAPGDYVFGGEGLDAVVTQLLGQLENAGPPPLPRDRIASLPTETAGETHALTACSVCWDQFQIGETLSRLECDHVFHSSCITPWLQLHATCPICRRSLLPDEPPPAASNEGSASMDADSESTSAPHSDSSTGPDVGSVGTMLLGLMVSWFNGLLNPPLPSTTTASAPQPSSRPATLNSSLPRVSLRRLTRRSMPEAASAVSDTTTTTSGLSSTSSTSVSSDRPTEPDRDRYNMDIDYD